MTEFGYRLGQLPNARQAAINAATNHTTVQAEANALDATGKLWKLMRDETVTKAIGPACSQEISVDAPRPANPVWGPVLSRGISRSLASAISRPGTMPS